MKKNQIEQALTYRRLLHGDHEKESKKNEKRKTTNIIACSQSQNA
jgi:hypothetical protein